MKQRRKLIVYRNMGELAYFEYYYDGVLKNEKQVKDFLDKHPNYEYGSIQVIRKGPKARLQEYYTEVRSTPQTVSQILESCKMLKQMAKEDKPVVLKDEKEYTYNRETAEVWLKIAKDNDWDLTVSIKPLCDFLGLAPVVVAPVLQRYGFIEKRKKLTEEEKEKTAKYSKAQVEVWWNDKLREGLTTPQQAEKAGIHFLQLGRLFTKYGFQPKKEKKEKKRGRK